MSATPSSRPPRDLKALKRRRLKAAGMFDQGATQARVARELGVSAQTASRWYWTWRAGGRAGLRGAARLGRPSRLTSAPWRRVERVLLAGAGSAGFDTELWTLARVAAVIQETTGWTTTPTTSPNCCTVTAGRRSGPPAARWNATRPRSPAGSRRSGPRSQGAAKQGKWIVFLDEAVSLRLNPPIRRTWAPRGQTPILTERRRNLPTLSMAALACYYPGGQAEARLLYDFHEGGYDTVSLIRVLERLGTLLTARRSR